MSKLLAVFGATGQQGGSVIDTVLSDPELRKQYTLRGITRDTSKPAALALQQKGVEVVQGDANDHESLQNALKDAHTVFINTVSNFVSPAAEVTQGRAIADAAVSAGAQYLISSSEPPASQISGKPVEIFDVKAEIETYIRSLPVKSAFFDPGFFMQNFSGNITPRPSPTEPGTYIIANIMKPDTQVPLIDIAADSGKYVAAILADPEGFEGKTMWAGTKLYTLDEVAEVISAKTGKTVKFQQLPEDVWKGFLPEVIREHYAAMMTWYRDYGYFGPEMKERVEWTAARARGKLTTFEEYLERCPMHLQ